VLHFPDISPYVPLLGPYEFNLGSWHVGPLGIRWYALAYIAGIVAGWRYGVGLIKTPRLWGARTPTATSAQIDDLILWLTLAIVVGGRLGSVVFYNTKIIWTHPVEILQIWNGGMSFHGAVIAVAITLVLFARANKMDLLRLADLVAPCVPFGLFFGRIANFINGELWGRPTHAPWGMVFCNKMIAAEHNGACPSELLVPRHPSQLYEATLEGIVLFLILRWATHKAHWLERQGAITGLFLACYGVFRVSLENVREPDENMPLFPLGLTMGMMLSIPMIIAGLWLIWRALKTRAASSSPSAA
jgi:phosphatidylglycerol:prolipoprotein diacylglycerol transferase